MSLLVRQQMIFLRKHRHFRLQFLCQRLLWWFQNLTNDLLLFLRDCKTKKYVRMVEFHQLLQEDYCLY